MYEELEIKLFTGDDVLTAEEAKTLLGWEAEEEGEKFGTDYLLKDLTKTKVRCQNNVTNRPLYRANVDKLHQEITRKNWRFNGEPIIVSQSGKILNGQHQLIALVLAHQEWEENGSEGEEPSIEKLVVFGVEDDDQVINTMDTCKPRSLADVIYRSPYFAYMDKSEQKKVANVCSFAIRTLWERLGSIDAFSVKQTHAESLTFLQEHQKLEEAVEFIQTEDNENSLGRYCSLGTLAGLLYLMGSSSTDPTKYKEEPCEENLKWDNWDKAVEYFVLLSSDSKDVAAVSKAFEELLKRDGVASREEKVAILISGWHSFVAGKKPKSIKLNYLENDGETVLADYSTGGIDLLSE